MSDSIFYEQPLNERMRSFLRLEHLFKQAAYTLRGYSIWDSRSTLTSITSILDLLSRNDLKTELLKELERQEKTLSALADLPGVDKEQLTNILKQIEISQQNILNLDGQLGQNIREHELLSSLRQRSSIVGGTCDFDIPYLHYWLQQPPEYRIEKLEYWLEMLEIISHPISLILDITRESSSPINTIAEAGFYQQNIDSLRAGDLEDHSRVWCSPDGVPRIWAQPYPFRIVQTPGQTTILYERNGIYRLVQMDTPVPDVFDLFPYFMGNSYGHWEGDTLVIEVVGFKARTTFMDDTGVPQSDQLRVIERLRKIGDDQLEVVVTIEDPVVFTRPWDARFLFERRDDIQHFNIWVCGEDHRDVSEVEGAAQ